MPSHKEREIAYDRIENEPGYAARRIEALTSVLGMIEQGHDFPAPGHDHRRLLHRADMRDLAREALDPDYVSHDG